MKQSDKLRQEAIENYKSINEQIDYLRTLETSEMINSIIKQLEIILLKYTTEKEIVQITLPKSKWAAFLEFEKQYKN